MTTPRVLCIMGSGETAPTMVSIHAALMTAAGSPPGRAVVIDSPFGFQENADDLTARTVAYFRDHVGHPITPAVLRTPDADVSTVARATEDVRTAAVVFAGPGSPSYALRTWRATGMPAVFAERLRAGSGTLVFSSAAAVTVGRWALPVYEVYKVGEAARWLEGMDLLSTLGIAAAVIPHWDNAEGGTHDTRYCYMGERRLRALEAELPDEGVVIGVCEHTALVIDVGEGTATVRGRGTAVVRRRGIEDVLRAGETVPLERLTGSPTLHSSAATSASVTPASDPAPATGGGTAPIAEGVVAAQAGFDEALARGDAQGAVDAVVGLDAHLAGWAADTLQTDEVDRGRAALRGLVVRLGDAARGGLRDPRDAVGPFIELALTLRSEARAAKRWQDADLIRDRLLALGVEVRDSASGSEWVLAGGDA